MITRSQTSVHTNTPFPTHTHTLSNTHIPSHLHTYMHTYTHTRAHTHTHTHTQTCIRTHTHTRTHRHTHTHTHTNRELLGYLNQDQLVTLERALCSAEGLGTLRRKANSSIKKRKTSKQPLALPQTDSQAQSSQSIPDTPAELTADSPNPIEPEAGSGDDLTRSYNLDSRESTDTVFEPTPVHVAGVNNVNNQSKEDGANSTVLVTEETPFPQLGDHEPIPNELPSSSDPLPTTSLDDAPQLATGGEVTASLSQASPVNKNGCKTGKKLKHTGPAGFPSAEDLMHRLFLGISGVADQLQMNHAKDLRVILKHVFTVCQSEPEDVTESITALRSHDEDCEVVRGEPCTPEPQSPLITASQS